MRVSVTLLQYDHGLIRQVAEVLDHMIKHKMVEKHFEIAREIVDFQSRFTDALHHRKEERFLFPAALENGSLKREEYDGLFADHDRARARIKAMGTALSTNDLAMFNSEAAAYVEMMLKHIHHEEDVFFPHIEENMSSDLDAMIFKQFDDFLSSNFPADIYPASEAFANKVQDAILGPGYFERGR